MLIKNTKQLVIKYISILLHDRFYLLIPLLELVVLMLWAIVYSLIQILLFADNVGFTIGKKPGISLVASIEQKKNVCFE